MRPAAASTVTPSAQPTALRILCAISAGHLLNDTIQSLLPALYPLLKTSLDLSFAQIGLITLAFQLTASLLQPVVGLVTDHHPQPYSLATGMGFTLVGLVLLALASSFPAVLVAGALVGLGSAIFHPEASRVARMASGGRHGFAQSLFQVGGNAGSALGPLLAALFIACGQDAACVSESAVGVTRFELLDGGGLYAAVTLPNLIVDRKSTRLNSSHITNSYAVFCLKKKKK